MEQMNGRSDIPQGGDRKESRRQEVHDWTSGGNTRRAIDFHESAEINEEALKSLFLPP